MLHPSYTELMKVINGDSEEEKVISDGISKLREFVLRKEEYLLRVKDTSELDELKDKYVNESDFRQKIALKKQIEKGIKLAQKKYKTDIFGFGNLFYKKYPQYYKKVNENWNEKTFPEIDIKIDTNINLMTKGSIEKSLLGGIHE